MLMNMLTLFKSDQAEAHRVPEEVLEDILLELLNYGRPTVGVYGSDMKWHCGVEMNTNTVGSDFKVRSDWNHNTPIEAAKVCRERVLKAVAIYKALP